MGKTFILEVRDLWGGALQYRKVYELLDKFWPARKTNPRGQNFLPHLLQHQKKKGIRLFENTQIINKITGALVFCRKHCQHSPPPPGWENYIHVRKCIQCVFPKPESHKLKLIGWVEISLPFIFAHWRHFPEHHAQNEINKLPPRGCLKKERLSERFRSA